MILLVRESREPMLIKKCYSKMSESVGFPEKVIYGVTDDANAKEILHRSTRKGLVN